MQIQRINQKKYMFEALQSYCSWERGSQNDSYLESCSQLLLIFFHAFVAGILLYLFGLQRIFKGISLTPLPNFPSVLFGKHSQVPFMWVSSFAMPGFRWQSKEHPGSLHTVRVRTLPWFSSRQHFREVNGLSVTLLLRVPLISRGACKVINLRRCQQTGCQCMPHRGDLACRAVIYRRLFHPIQVRWRNLPPSSEGGKQPSTRAVLVRSRCYENAREMQVGGCGTTRDAVVARADKPRKLTADQVLSKLENIKRFRIGEKPELHVK